MNPSSSPAFAGFRRWVTRKYGLAFDDGRLDLLAETFRERLRAHRGMDPGEYLRALESGAFAVDEEREIARRLTVGESYFFRNRDHFEAFAEEVVPDLLTRRAARRELRVLSAGCATGEEPYSIAMLLDERFPELAGWKVTIAGVDLNPSFLERARAGRYTAWSLRDTSASWRGRYFRREGARFELAPEIRQRVVFEERNLVTAGSSLFAAGAWDVVFCRNVTIYLAREAVRSLVEDLARALEPDGYLFLGHAETLRGLTQDFHLIHRHDTFFYRLRSREHRATAARRQSDLAAGATEPTAEALDDTWTGAISAASRRVAKLLARPDRRAAAGARPDLTRPSGPSYAQALELMREERHDEALAMVQAMELEAPDVDALALLAVLLTNQGEVERAEDVCRRILEIDELNAGAHYLLALCHEHAGRRGEAVEHDRIAIYLDAGFAMAHLHLGLLAKRNGSPGEARDRLERARDLLADEDASRLLLYGGGFTREALVGICRGELGALEAAES